MVAPSKSMCRFLIGCVLGGAYIAASVSLGFAEPSGAPPSNDGTTNAAARGGQWVHADPQTGARTMPSPGDTAAAIAGNPAFSTSQQGLVQQPAPGGGVMVDLQGRFRSAAEATAGPDGKVSVDCRAPGVPGGKE